MIVLMGVSAILLSYLVGSIPTGLLFSKLILRIDIRDYGSGRTGATNIYRVAGWKGSAVVFAIDLAKGTIAIILTKFLGGDIVIQSYAAVAAIVGHSWPITAGFRGGRGVTPALGALFIVHFPLAILSLGLGLAIIVTSRYASLGSLIGVAIGCVGLLLMIMMGQLPAGLLPYPIGSFILVYFQHRDNIVRLLKRQERRIGQS